MIYLRKTPPLLCLLESNIQMRSETGATIINADYCAAPSIRSEYILTGIMYHPTFTEYYELNGADRVIKTFASYPDILTTYKNFMGLTPYRSVWVDSNCDGGKDALTAGAELVIGKTIYFSEAKTINIGIFGDNQFKILIDGELQVHAPKIGNGQLNFLYMHLFTFEISAGSHYFSFAGIGDGSVSDSLGVIVYDNDIDYLLSATTKTNWNVLYSSENSLIESIDIAECPEDYSYDNTLGKCINITETTTGYTGTTVLFTPELTCTLNPTIISWELDYGDLTSISGTTTLPETLEHQYLTVDDFIATLTVVTSNRTYTSNITITILSEST